MSAAAVEDQLFGTDSMASQPPAVVKVAVDKTFRVYDQDQSFLMPPSLRDWLPEGHLAHLVSELVDEVLDLSAFRTSYTEERGYPPYDPRLMLKILLYGYTTGVRSSRKIEVRCHEDVAFRLLAANAAPDFRSVARFRKRHLDALEALFLQVLTLCQAAGMVKMGRVALDGTKIRANASRHKAMSYARMGESQAKLEAEVAAMMREAQRVDAEEDAAYGADDRGDDLHGEMARRESRLAKIRKAKADLEAQAKAKAADKAREKAEKAGKTPAQTEEAATAAGESAVPHPKAQRNFTDPDARIMKTSDGSFHYCYNGQAVVDEANQIIVAADFAESGADNPEFAEMLDQSVANTASTPRETLADAGYFSADNVAAAVERHTEAFIATGRLKHGEEVPAAPRGRIPKDATPKERMARKLRTKKGKAAYARRKALVSHCTSSGRFGRGSSGESAAHVGDEAGVAGDGRLVELFVLVVGLVGDEQAGPAPVLDGVAVHAELCGDLVEGEHPAGAEPLGVVGQSVRAA
jgi:transposase